MHEARDATRVVVVGGGLAGLAAATFAARAGHDVTLLERSAALGGRAATHVREGFHLNQGPHALYRAGAGMAVLEELGIAVRGAPPAAARGVAIADGRLHALPGGALSMLTTSLLRVAEKVELARMLARLGRIDPAPLDAVPAAEWIAAALRHRRSREALEALVRLTTYVHAPGRLSAGLALRQLHSGLTAGVLYLDGGWQQLVDALRERAAAAGVRIRTGMRVAHVEPGVAVTADDGTRLPADWTVLAISPAAAARLVPAPGLLAAAARLTPVPAACLDVALEGLPRPRVTFALGIDEPTYYSVHSAAAQLAPAGGAMVHVLRYLGPGEATGDDGDANERVLEAVLDLVQPGWRARVRYRRYLPRMVTTHALPGAEHGGLAGRPGVRVAGVPGVLVAGDWVGPVGHLADASLASGRAAAKAIGQCRDARAA